MFESYLRHGFYPYFLEYDDEKLFYMTLEQNLHTMIESDHPAVHSNLTGASVRKLKRLLAKIAAMVPFTVDIKNLKTIVSVTDERTLKSYLNLLDDAGIITQVYKAGSKLSALEKPEKIYLNNPNQMYALKLNDQIDRGTLRETFFVSMLKHLHEIEVPKAGDFFIDESYVVEIGGQKKNNKQIHHLENAYIAADKIEMGRDNKLPLWLFGFLY